ncbi:hypothetical protein SeLEV6574_g03453 [Synchytrium endobioticum]|nr:hypothetical protein SeLEV6574_g03453 [Synchytrium endobioticum]
MTPTEKPPCWGRPSSSPTRHAQHVADAVPRPSYKRRLVWAILIAVVVVLAALSVAFAAFYRAGRFPKSSAIQDNLQAHNAADTIASAKTTIIAPSSTTSLALPQNASIVLSTATAKTYTANLAAASDNLVNGSDWLGFGTSLSWWAQWMGNHFYGTADFTNLMDAFFDVNTGLGLSVARFNLGATVNPPSTYSPYVIMPAAKNSSNAPFDFDVDKGQRYVLLEAIKRGVSTTELFINSPPEWMTISGVSCGNYGHGNNLNASKYQDYANYVVDTLLYYNNTVGVEFGSVTVFSEPTSNWWGPPDWCNQEGFHQDIGTLAPILRTLSHTIQSAGLSTIIAGTDEVSYDVAQSVLTSMSSSDLSTFQRINIHGYYDPAPSVRKSFATTARSVGKKVWQSELGTAGTGMQPVQYGIRQLGAIGLARNIIADVYFIGVTAWCYWQVMDQGDWGLYYCQYLSPGVCNRSKQYYVMMQFSKWLRPGMDIINVPQNDDPNVLLARSRSTNRLVVVAINQKSSAATYAINVSLYAVGLNGSSSSNSIVMGVFRTSNNENHDSVVSDTSNFGYGTNGVVYLGNCPGNSVTTLVLDGLTWQAGV